MYPLVRELAVDGVPVAVTCRVLKIARQPYYRWLVNPVTDAWWPVTTTPHDSSPALAGAAPCSAHQDLLRGSPGGAGAHGRHDVRRLRGQRRDSGEAEATAEAAAVETAAMAAGAATAAVSTWASKPDTPSAQALAEVLR